VSSRKRLGTILESIGVTFMVVSRCRGIGPPSGIPSPGLFFFAADLRRHPTSRVSISQSAECFCKSIYRHLGNTPPRSTV